MACCIIFTGLATGYDYNNNNHVEGDHTAPAEWKIMFDQKKKKKWQGLQFLELISINSTPVFFFFLMQVIICSLLSISIFKQRTVRILVFIFIVYILVNHSSNSVSRSEL